MAKESRKPEGDVDAMLREVQESGRDRARPSRLFACACGRLIWHLLTDDLGRPSIELSERYADGRAKWTDLRREFARIAHNGPGPSARPDLHRAALDILMVFEFSAESAGIAARHARLGSEARSAAQRDLIRDIFGDPTLSNIFDPTWKSPVVADLARTIYDTHNFDAMPMLGDALEEAGCDRPEILDHCRKPGSHARGCWVLDASMEIRRSGKD